MFFVIKKFFLMILFAAIIIFTGNNQVKAQDVYVGTSNTTGRDCYIMTETINGYIKGRRGITTDVTLKMVRRSDNNIQYLYYQFYEDGNSAPHFTNSQGYEGIINEYNTPIEWKMYEVIRKYQ